MYHVKLSEVETDISEGQQGVNQQRTSYLKLNIESLVIKSKAPKNAGRPRIPFSRVGWHMRFAAAVHPIVEMTNV